MQNLRNADGDRATLSGRRTTPPVLALGPRPASGAGHEYTPDELSSIDPVRSAIVAAFWMLCGAGVFALAYLAYSIIF
jgi:hypothetical protein